jgi:hypothetical protein
VKVINLTQVEISEKEEQIINNMRLVKKHGHGEVFIIIKDGEVFESDYKFKVRETGNQEKLKFN